MSCYEMVLTGLCSGFGSQNLNCATTVKYT